MKKQYLSVILLLIILAACAPAKRNALPTPTTPSPAGPLDGTWQGSGQADGRAFKIFFTIKNSVVSDIKYSYNNPQNTSCLNINYTPIDKAHRPRITNHSFSATLGSGPGYVRRF